MRARHGRRRSRLALPGLVAAAALTLGVLAAPGAAVADGSSGSASAASDGCVAYATGTGMGSYCLGGGGDVQTLRERFSGQTFDRCRYSEIPPGMDEPFNPSPDEGRWLVRKCINNLDFDTFDGGPARELNIHLAYLPLDFDITYDASPLGDFLWDRVEVSTQFPVPFLQAEPTTVPRVGVPTYFTFRWVDPATNRPVRQGQYADSEDGGPYVELDNQNGLQMRAQARLMRINPRQNDMAIKDCDTVTPQYDPTIGPAGDQPNSCWMTFKRSSASAKERMPDKETRDAAGPLGDVYLLQVVVFWEVEYSNDGQNWQTLDSGFTGEADTRGLIQATNQPLPVRESQAGNLPPRFTLQ